MDRFPILGAVTGILLTLLMDGTSERFVPFLFLECYSLTQQRIRAIYMIYREGERNDDESIFPFFY